MKALIRSCLSVLVMAAMIQTVDAQSPQRQQADGTSFGDQMRQQARIVQQQQQQFGGALPLDPWNLPRYRAGYRGYPGYGYPGYGHGYGYGYGYPVYGYPIYSYPTYGYPPYYRYPLGVPGTGSSSQSRMPGSHYFGDPHASQSFGN